MFPEIIGIFVSYFTLNKNRRSTEPKVYPELSGGDSDDPFYVSEPTSVYMPEQEPQRFRVKLISVIDQLFTYFGIIVGILFSSIMRSYGETGVVTFNLQTNELIISIIVGIMVFPNIYKKLAGTKDPFFYRFALAIQNGVFWQVIFGSMI